MIVKSISGFYSLISPYVKIARIDHWFKNAFMILGMLIAFFYSPQLLSYESVPVLLKAFFSTCIIASSNYVINELVDAPLDRRHPEKKNRPAARGLIKGWIAIVEWMLLGIFGVIMAFTINRYFALFALMFWVQGFLYNVRPFRTKDIPYLDVLSESVNNPIRLFLGWHALIVDRIAPISITIAYWMAGAFFMAIKRYAEYRHLGNKSLAAEYRKSFQHYDEHKLLLSIMFYISACALFTGIFISRYKAELILSVPLLAGFFTYYMKLGLQENSPVQFPEKLYQERGFFLYSLFTVAVFILLMYSEIPMLYRTFNVDTSLIEPLWKIGQ